MTNKEVTVSHFENMLKQILGDVKTGVMPLRTDIHVEPGVLENEGNDPVQYIKDRKFLKRLREGRRAEQVVAIVLEECGIRTALEQGVYRANENRKYKLPDLRVTNHEDEEFFLEVKTTHTLKFRTISDIYRDTVIVDGKYAYDQKAEGCRALETPFLGTVILSPLAGGAVVIPHRTKPEWLESTRYDQWTERKKTNYLAPVSCLRSFPALVNWLLGDLQA